MGENPDHEWYPEDIDPEALNPTEGRTVPEEQGDESSEQASAPQEIKKKPKERQSRKDKVPQEPTRSSSRKNKGEHHDAFTKKHFTTYISFVAAQIANQFVPQSLKAAIEGPDRDMWLAACRKQLGKIEKKQSWELCHLPKGSKALPTKWVFDPKMKARLVVCGNFKKKTDVETFAAVVNMTMVKIFFLLVAILNWECFQYDFEAAFLNREMKLCKPPKSDPKVRPKSPNSESDHNSNRTSDGPDRTVRIAPANRNATRRPDRDNNRSGG